MQSDDVSVEVWNAYVSTIRQWGLERYEDAILGATAPAIGLRWSPDKYTTTSSNRTYFSKAGGIPDLPPHISWPAFQDGLIPFVAQIDFGELPASITRIFRATALLIFFIGRRTKLQFGHSALFITMVRPRQ
jgi:uncharacterized protein YwqG